MSKLRRALPRILDAKPVGLACFYGSRTTDQVTPVSDVDLALVVDEDLSALERLKLTLGVQIDIADGCDISNADVRLVNDAPLIFRGKAVCEGILVFARDEQERVAFETDTCLWYLDYQPHHRKMPATLFADLRDPKSSRTSYCSR